MPLPELWTGPMTLLHLADSPSPSWGGTTTTTSQSQPDKVRSFHLVCFISTVFSLLPLPFLMRTVFVEAPTSPNMWMNCSSSDAVTLCLMHFLSKRGRGSIRYSRGHFCIDNEIWKKTAKGLFALFTSWLPNELWNWLYDTCWCKTLTRECWITPPLASTSQETPCECVTHCHKGQGLPALKICSVVIPLNHHGIFLPSFITRHLKTEMCCIPSLITVNSSPAGTGSRPWAVALSKATGASSVQNLFCLPFLWPLWGIWAQYPYPPNPDISPFWSPELSAILCLLFISQDFSLFLSEALLYLLKYGWSPRFDLICLITPLPRDLAWTDMLTPSPPHWK